MMYWRQIRAAELSACLDLQPACIGDGLVGREAALRVWSELGASPAFHANVIESERPGMARRLVGCGIGVFVEADFVDRELKTPQPGLNSRIIASIARSESVVLDYAAIAAGNAGSGLDFVNLYGTWREDVLDADELAEVQTLLGTSFVEAFAGYRFNRVLKEAIGRSRIDRSAATASPARSWRSRPCWPRTRRPPMKRSTSRSATSVDAAPMPGSAGRFIALPRSPGRERTRGDGHDDQVESNAVAPPLRDQHRDRCGRAHAGLPPAERQRPGG
jgi:hypothetical protein